METKDTNPKDAVGTRKVPISTVPCGPLFELGLAMLEGARKYGRHNYRAAGVRASVYYDACLRHMMAWYEGEDIDPDSGLSHIIKAMACLLVLRDSMHMGNWIDDRPPRLPEGLGLSELNEQASKLIDLHPDAKEPFTQVGRTTTTGKRPEYCGGCANFYPESTNWRRQCKIPTQFCSGDGDRTLSCSHVQPKEPTA